MLWLFLDILQSSLFPFAPSPWNLRKDKLSIWQSQCSHRGGTHPVDSDGKQPKISADIYTPEERADEWIQTWWRHQMETFFRVTGHLCGEYPVPGEFSAQSPVTLSFEILLDLRLNKRLSKQSWGWWFETLTRPLWRHSNEIALISSDCVMTGFVMSGTMFKITATPSEFSVQSFGSRLFLNLIPWWRSWWIWPQRIRLSQSDNTAL